MIALCNTTLNLPILHTYYYCFCWVWPTYWAASSSSSALCLVYKLSHRCLVHWRSCWCSWRGSSGPLFAISKETRDALVNIFKNNTLLLIACTFRSDSAPVFAIKILFCIFKCQVLNFCHKCKYSCAIQERLDMCVPRIMSSKADALLIA